MADFEVEHSSHYGRQEYATTQATAKIELTRATDLGPHVSSLPAAIPDTSIPLKGTYVTLEAISQTHIESLWRNLDLQGNGAALLDFLPWSEPDSPEALWTLLQRLGTDRGFLVYAIKADPQHVNPTSQVALPRQHKETVGIIAYLNVSPANRELEVGAVLFSKILQRSAAATEVMYLMLENACEASPCYRRISWKCNSLNKSSRRAAERVGFRYEGTFRNHMIVKGRSRDSDWLSIIDDEWPEVKATLEQWLRKDNFDECGRQIRTMDDIRAGIKGTS